MSLAADVAEAPHDGASGSRLTGVSSVRFDTAQVLGTGASSPRLSWALVDEQVEVLESEIDIRIENEASVVTRVEGGVRSLISWPTRPLRSRERADVRVRVRTASGWGPHSATATVETGLLERDDWTASWISPRNLGGIQSPAPRLSRRVAVDGDVARARLYVTARGLYDITIGGMALTDARLTPGWTSYDHRFRYQTYDITDHLQGNDARIDAVLGNGWYRGQLVWPDNRAVYGERLALFAQVEIEYTDGRVDRIVTDSDWVASDSGILLDDLYDGETVDMRVPVASLEESSAIDVLPDAPVALEAPSAPPVRPTQCISPVSVETKSDGRIIVDFGQNLVGHPRLVVRSGASGAHVVVRHAEVLEHGELAVRPLRSAKATSTFILSGDDEECLEPTFTFYGFRFAEISGVLATDLEITAVVVGSDLERIGTFRSSDAMLNRLHENVVWSARGNFLDIPTDCPQRDERLGWTGDIAAFAPTAAFLFDVDGFLAGWLRDLSLEQRPNGAVPDTVPDVLGNDDPGSAGWGDAAVVVPMALWKAYGDREVLRRQYPSMRAWIEFVTSRAPGLLWTESFQYGDWLDPTAPAERPEEAQADPHVVATAMFARSAGMLADAAIVLGFREDAERYLRLHDDIVAAFARAYVDDDGRVLSDCQTVYALALCMDLLPTRRQRSGAGKRLVELVRCAEHRVRTGFLGTPMILDALTVAGYTEDAMAMLQQQSPPSWLYAVSMSATTIWERWDAMLPDGTVHPGTMTSFNHYAYGAIADWMHRVIGGLTATEPGYRRVDVRPGFDTGLDSAEVRLRAPQGEIAVEWKATPRRTATVTVPDGVRATVRMPGAEPAEVGCGVHHFGEAAA